MFVFFRLNATRHLVAVRICVVNLTFFGKAGGGKPTMKNLGIKEILESKLNKGMNQFTIRLNKRALSKLHGKESCLFFSNNDHWLLSRWIREILGFDTSDKVSCIGFLYREYKSNFLLPGTK